ncbi:DUF1802 family protein [Paenibacillus protaetiae]|uniref:DUF1802 family protein n=2 Tax=Paenibacillus protaetiae TaxID=2509456 RepID=A0A4P6ERC8_9BACL|nr:DUF1802 family protein [Paenibacillus protaetiae]
MGITIHRDPIVLKEWAVIIKALLEGKQIVVMRKGGIREEAKDFQLVSDSFYLFPTYEHQKEELLKEQYRGELAETLTEWPLPEGVPLRAYAAVEEDIEITDPETLKKLEPFHIWTERFAEERLRWKKTKPLHLLLLRVYRLDEPKNMPLRDSYNGCKSWVRLEDEAPSGGMTPVLSAEQFQAEASRIREALQRIQS